MNTQRHHICEYCGKGVQYGHNVSHAKNRTRVIKKPNLKVMRVLEHGKIVKRRLCMKCLKKATRLPKPSNSPSQK